ncbi:potassium channel protein, partial [Bacillus sonorensis]|nr:potassium channel protein [Bacillus sonorensis]
GANQIISTAELLKTAMLQHFLIKSQLPEPIFQEADIHLKIHAIPVPERMAGNTFKEVVHHFMKDDIFIVGVQQKDGPILPPSFSYTVKKSDKLLSF